VESIETNIDKIRKQHDALRHEEETKEPPIWFMRILDDIVNQFSQPEPTYQFFNKHAAPFEDQILKDILPILTIIDASLHI
jgi:hypothetical protein